MYDKCGVSCCELPLHRALTQITRLKGQVILSLIHLGRDSKYFKPIVDVIWQVLWVTGISLSQFRSFRFASCSPSCCTEPAQDLPVPCLAAQRQMSNGTAGDNLISAISHWGEIRCVHTPVCWFPYTCFHIDTDFFPAILHLHINYGFWSQEPGNVLSVSVTAAAFFRLRN